MVIFGDANVTLTGDGLGAFDAALSEEFAEAVRTVGLVLFRRELLSSKNLLTVGAGEAVAMPRCVLVRDTALVDHLQTKE